MIDNLKSMLKEKSIELDEYKKKIGKENTNDIRFYLL